jgi:hypothetical protein
LSRLLLLLPLPFLFLFSSLSVMPTRIPFEGEEAFFYGVAVPPNKLQQVVECKS